MAAINGCHMSLRSDNILSTYYTIHPSRCLSPLIHTHTHTNTIPGTAGRTVRTVLPDNTVYQHIVATISHTHIHFNLYICVSSYIHYTVLYGMICHISYHTNTCNTVRNDAMTQGTVLPHLHSSPVELSDPASSAL